MTGHARRRVAPAIALGLVLLAPSTRAADGEAIDAPREPERPASGGIYLRLSLGASYMYLARETTSRGTGGTFLYLGDSSTLEGFAAATALSVGAAVAPGLVVAGTWMGLALPGAELVLQDGRPAELGAAMTAFVIGPTVDVYPGRSGLHFGGGVGYLAYAVDVLAPPGGIGGQGAAVLGHAGWDLWLDRDWAVGLGLRGALGRVEGTEAGGGVEGTEVTTVQLLGLDASVLLL